MTPTSTCDRCGEPVPLKPAETPTKGGGARMELRCPHCGAVYLVAHVTRAGLDLRDRLKVARRQARRDPSRLDRVRELEAAYAREVTKLDPTGGGKGDGG